MIARIYEVQLPLDSIPTIDIDLNIEDSDVISDEPDCSDLPLEERITAQYNVIRPFTTNTKQYPKVS